MTAQCKVRTCLWFARRGIDAAQFYVGLLPDSRIDAVFDHGQPDDPLVVEFTLAGAPMMILTGGDMFQHSPAASISVLTKDQASVAPFPAISETAWPDAQVQIYSCDCRGCQRLRGQQQPGTNSPYGHHSALADHKHFLRPGIGSTLQQILAMMVPGTCTPATVLQT